MDLKQVTCRLRSPSLRAAEMRPLMMKLASKEKGERKRNLMVSMIDGCLKSRGSGAVSIVSPDQSSTATATPAPPCGLGPAVYLTVHLREGLTKVKVEEGRGGAGRGREGGVSLAGCLHCAVAGRPSRDSARLRCGETRQGLPGGLMPCNED